jgi:hypothetical protein
MASYANIRYTYVGYVMMSFVCQREEDDCRDLLKYSETVNCGL